jgi:hypothetical protein
MGFGGLFVDEYQLPAEPEQEAVDKKKDPLAKGEVAWGAPLQHDWQFAEPPKRLSSRGEEQGSSANGQSGWDPAAARSGAGLVAAATAVAAAAQPPPGSAISLAMRLVEGSQAAGITGGQAGAQWAGIGAVVAGCQLSIPCLCACGIDNALQRIRIYLFQCGNQWDAELAHSSAVFCVCSADVTRRASQLLLAHRGLLTAPQLARLAAKMSEVGMTQEITGLVDSSVASGSHQGQAVGFVAAALTGACAHHHHFASSHSINAMWCVL